MLSACYTILYGQLYVMLKSIKSKISNKTFKKHSVAVVSTVMQVRVSLERTYYIQISHVNQFQNLVFVLFFLFPIFLLAIVIYSGKDASG